MPQIEDWQNRPLSAVYPIILWDSGYLCNIKLLTYDLWIEIIPEQ